MSKRYVAEQTPRGWWRVRDTAYTNDHLPVRGDQATIERIARERNKLDQQEQARIARNRVARAALLIAKQLGKVE